MDLPDKLKKARQSIDKSQQEMAVLIGCAHRSWQGYEQGRNTPGGDVFKALADLGFNINWFFAGDDVPMLAEQQGKLSSAAIQPTSQQELAITPNDKHSLGENVELLAKIHNSGYNSLIRAISANLVAFSEAIDNRGLADSTVQRMELMEVRMEQERAAWAKERDSFEQRLQRLEERGTEEPGQKKSVAA